jgi:hypothetical protein
MMNQKRKRKKGGKYEGKEIKRRNVEIKDLRKRE